LLQPPSRFVFLRRLADEFVKLSFTVCMAMFSAGMSFFYEFPRVRLNVFSIDLSWFESKVYFCYYENDLAQGFIIFGVWRFLFAYPIDSFCDCLVVLTFLLFGWWEETGNASSLLDFCF
jgi:hypothetical protein